MQNITLVWRLKSWLCLQALTRKYSSRATIPSLRPFYLIAHPDFLWQHPAKKEVNENSLKQLNEFIGNLQSNAHPIGPTTLQFYLKSTGSEIDHRLVNIQLDNKSLKKTVENILSSCSLLVETSEDPLMFTLPVGAEEESVKNKCFFYKKLPRLRESTLQKRITKSQNMDLVKFLSTKASKAHSLLQGLQVTKRTVQRLTQEMKENLYLEDIVWDNQWTYLQHRNCIEDLARLSKQYQLEMDHLSGRTLVFGNETGLYLNGDISFGCCDSRRLWIDMLQKILKDNEVLREIWKAESQLMEQLKGTKVVHQPLKPSLAIEKYLYWIQRLSHVLEQTAAQKCSDLPTRSEPLRILFDCDSNELKLLKTGVIIVCPQLSAPDILKFLTEHFEKAAENTQLHRNQTSEELVIHRKCVMTNHMGFLSKDENVSPQNMIKCCEALLISNHKLQKLLQNLHICVSDYYIGNEDGVLCIPWCWQTFQ